MSLRLHNWASSVVWELFLLLMAFAVYFRCRKCLFILGIPEGSGPCIGSLSFPILIFCLFMYLLLAPWHRVLDKLLVLQVVMTLLALWNTQVYCF